MNFDNNDLDLYVVLTMTNWNEPPRIRHEVSHLLSKANNVLFIQLHEQRKYSRSNVKVNSNLIVRKIGFSFPGLTRLFWAIPSFRKIYYLYISFLLRGVISRYKYKKIIVVNFQYDFPEVFNIDLWDAKIFFCNDDFVNQKSNQLLITKKLKENIQIKTIAKSDLVLTVSDPLCRALAKHSNNVKIIYSGHRFDLSKSLSAKYSEINLNNIKVCYLGFLNQGVAIDWFEHILSYENIELTVIGPVPSDSYLANLVKNNRFKHIDFLVDERLQLELLEHDIMLMPYSSSVENTVTSVPAKLYQYLAVGKPIVSSAMENLIELPTGFVYKSQTKEEFYQLIMRSAKENSVDLKIKRIDFSAMNTWEKRGVQMQQYVQEIFKDNKL